MKKSMTALMLALMASGVMAAEAEAPESKIVQTADSIPVYNTQTGILETVTHRTGFMNVKVDKDGNESHTLQSGMEEKVDHANHTYSKNYVNQTVSINGSPVATETSVKNLEKTITENTETSVKNLEKTITENTEASVKNLEKTFAEKFGDVSKRASAGSASAIAHSYISYASGEEKGVFSIGAGNYDGQSAIAMGFSAGITKTSAVKVGIARDAYKTSFGAGFRTAW
jgi:autotransporter adhesin